MSDLFRQHLYLGLSFLASSLTDKDFYSVDAAKRIVDRAQKISDFCNLYAPNIADLPAVQLVNEAGAEELDKTIGVLLSKDARSSPSLSQMMRRLCSNFMTACSIAQRAVSIDCSSRKFQEKN